MKYLRKRPPWLKKAVRRCDYLVTVVAFFSFAVCFVFCTRFLSLFFGLLSPT